MATISADYLTAALEKLRTDIRSDLKDEITVLRTIIDEQTKEIDSLKAVVADQQTSLLYLQRKDLERNMIISGLSEPNAEITDTEQINELLKIVDDKFQASTIDRFDRIGKQKPRLLKITFKLKETKLSLVRNGKKLRDIEKYEGVYINSDQTKLDRAESRRLRIKRKELKAENPTKAVYIKAGCLIMDDTEIDRMNPINQLFRTL